MFFKDQLEMHYHNKERSNIVETPLLELCYNIAKIFRREIHERQYGTSLASCGSHSVRKGQPVLTSLWYTPHVAFGGSGWTRWWLIRWDDGQWEWYPITFFRTKDKKTGIRYREC